MEGPPTHKPALPLPKRVIAAALGRVADWLGLKALLVYRRPLTTEPTIPADVLEKYAFRPLSAHEQAMFAADPALRLGPEFVAAASARGDICVGALFGNELAAYRWYAASGLAPCEGSLWVRNDHPHQIYTYKMFTAHEHRGRRLQLYTMIYGDALMAQRGFTHGILYVEANNTSSRSGLSRVPNQERVGIMVYMRLLGRYWTVRSPALKRYGFNLIEASKSSAKPHFTTKQ